MVEFPPDWIREVSNSSVLLYMQDISHYMLRGYDDDMCEHLRQDVLLPELWFPLLSPLGSLKAAGAALKRSRL